MSVRWEDGLTECRWMGAARLKALERMGLVTVGDLLSHFPRRWEDRTRFDRFPGGDEEKAVCIRGVVTNVVRKFLRGRQRMFDVELSEGGTTAFSSGKVTLRWFNAYWVEKAMAVGMELVVHGRPKRRARTVIMDHPEYEIVEEDAERSIHLDRIVPVHRATEGLSARMLRWMVWRLLEEVEDVEMPDLAPPGLVIGTRARALRQIHFPDSWEEHGRAREHLVLTEFFGMQLCIARKRAEQRSEPGEVHAADGELVRRFHEGLPFPLTGAQKRSVEEILFDLRSPLPMNRLLHGDVGSGKTVVAASAMLAAVEAGFQAALMAPTQILAEQHYANLKRWCEPLGVRVGLRTGNRREESGPLPLFDHERWLRGHVEGTGDRPSLPTTVPQILVGTHALLFEEDAFERLGVVVIDEQHKFGVLQRARLRGKGRVPDVLVMTATPIPRTMTMSVYGDLDVSTLDELPAGRGRVVTAVRDAAKLADAVDFFRGFLEAGRQLYIVYPLVDESEKMSVKSAVKEHERWVGVWKPLECGLLHGRMSPEEKEAVMGRFRAGELRVLVATTVIEVGIDVANANLMLIENSERFGLAQLHQLRGRIGRGAHKGYCVLLTSTDDPEARDKLRVLERTANGFEIAEADWELRGPGDVFGTAQSGIAPVRIGNLVRDADLMQRARGAAFVLMERDSGLEAVENRRYRMHLEMAGRKGDLADVS